MMEDVKAACWRLQTGATPTQAGSGAFANTAQRQTKFPEKRSLIWLIFVLVLEAQWLELISAVCATTRVPKILFSPGTEMGGIRLVKNVEKIGFEIMGPTEVPPATYPNGANMVIGQPKGRNGKRVAFLPGNEYGWNRLG